MALCGPVGLVQERMTVSAADEPRSHPIVSISVCTRSGGSGSAGSCPNGSMDTAQPVLAPDGTPINGSGSLANPYGGVSTLADEHSTILPPGTLPDHPDYLFFVATRTILGPDASGVTVLSGGSGPNDSGQWTLDLASDFGFYVPNNPAGSQNGQIFTAAMAHATCPAAPDPSVQDQTFDLNYADPGTVLIDPTNWANKGPGSLLMVYEETNRCIGIGNPNGPSPNKGNNFYSTIGIASSFDYGHSWATYLSNFNDLPVPNPSEGPLAPLGAFGSSVCVGNDCTITPPDGFGRYAVLSAAVTVAKAMVAEAARGNLPSNTGNSEPAGFVDDLNDGPDPYLYVIYNYLPGPFTQRNSQLNSLLIVSDLAIARARLNGGTAPLKFEKWYQGSFREPGLGADGGGLESSIFPNVSPRLYKNCLAPEQARTMGSISYVKDTHQYLLTFVCASPSDPFTANTDPGGGQQGAAWFYSTLDADRFDLRHQESWSLPQEIIASWSHFDNGNGGCFRNFNGWYPSFMSLDHKAGQLSTRGYVFYMRGCTDNDTPGGRQYSTRAFTIITERANRTGTEAPPSPE